MLELMQWTLCEWKKAIFTGDMIFLQQENPFEAGLGFAVKLNKEYDFIGKKSPFKKQKLTKKNNLIMFTLDQFRSWLPPSLHDEPIY